MAKAAKKNDITELKFQLSENKLQKMYIFYGDEEYLKEFYIKKIEALVPECGLAEYNRIVINGVQEYSVYDDVWEEMPVMTDRRLLVIRDSNIFTTRRSGDIVPPNDEQKQFWTEKFKRLSDDTVVIFCEKNVDARSALFKAASKAGFSVKCDFLSDADLKAWAVKKATKAGKKLDMSVAEYIVSITEPGLNNLSHEMNKLINFCDDIIYKTDVDRVVSKSMQVKIFDITDGIMAGDSQKVINVLNELKTQKESAFGILYLLYSSFEKMLHLKLANVKSRNEAAQTLGSNAWAAAKYFEGSLAFDTKSLTKLVTRVPETDYEIKCGLVAEWQALEQYVFDALNDRKKSVPHRSYA